MSIELYPLSGVFYNSVLDEYFILGKSFVDEEGITMDVNLFSLKDGNRFSSPITVSTALQKDGLLYVSRSTLEKFCAESLVPFFHRFIFIGKFNDVFIRKGVNTL